MQAWSSEWVLSSKLQFLRRIFMIHVLRFCKPTWYFNFSKLSDSCANIPVHLSDWCMMSIHREKISKHKQSFIERVIHRFGRNPGRLQLLFLSGADKQCCHFWCFERSFWCLVFWRKIWCWLGCWLCFPHFLFFRLKISCNTHNF